MLAVLFATMVVARLARSLLLLLSYLVDAPKALRMVAGWDMASARTRSSCDGGSVHTRRESRCRHPRRTATAVVVVWSLFLFVCRSSLFLNWLLLCKLWWWLWLSSGLML